MKRSLTLFLVLFVLIAPVAGDPVRLWTEYQDFTFPAGVEAKIPLHVENTAGGEIQGILRVVLTEVIDGQESGQRTESRTYVLRPGESILVVPAGTSDTPLVRLVRVNFDYTAGIPRTLALGDLTVRFVSDPGSEPGPATGPGLEAIPGVVQTPPIGNGINPSGTPDPFQTGQMTQDMESLQRGLQASEEEIERERIALNQRMMQDPSFVSINETMASGGYIPDTPLIDPESETEGQFSIEYRGQGGTSLVRGAIDGGVIQWIEAGSSSVLPAPPEFANSERYRELMTELAGQGFTPSGTTINITGNEVILRSEFSSKDSGTALLTGRARNGVVQSVGVEKDSGLIDYPAFGALVLLLAAMALLLVWHRRNIPLRREETDPPHPAASPSVDHSTVALGMLEEANAISSEGDLPSAYRKAGRALRFFVSHRYGSGDEMTDKDVIDLVKTINSPGQARISVILERCRKVGFARGEASPDEFNGLIHELSELVRKI